MTATDTRETAQYLIFQVANQSCAAALPEIAEIILMAELSPPFGPSDVLAGLLNIGGEALPILHLNRILNLPDSSSALYSHIVLVRTSSASVGFLTQAASKIVTTGLSEIKPLQAESVKPFFKTMIPDGKAFVGVLELRKIAEYYQSSLQAIDPWKALPAVTKVAS